MPSHSTLDLIMTGVPSEAAPAVAQIGRYFSVVSLVPATLLVGYLRWLLGTGALTGPVDWTPEGGLDLGSVATTAAVALIVALALNPLQYGIIQVLEGYWGTSSLATALRALRIRHHQAIALRLDRASLSPDLPSVPPPPGGEDQVAARLSLSRRDESRRLRAGYPRFLDDVVPTRLGNVLRRYEYSVGRPYKLELGTLLPRIAMVASGPELSYLQNQRIQMELAVRTTIVSLIATIATVGAFWTHGLLALVAIGPYLVAYLAYRGAILIAHEYGTAMAVVVDLNRFALYQRLGLAAPTSIDEERRQNESLARLFAGETAAHVDYDIEQSGILLQAAQPPDAAGDN